MARCTVTKLCCVPRSHCSCCRRPCSKLPKKCGGFTRSGAKCAIRLPPISSACRMPVPRVAQRVVLELTDRASLDSVSDVRERLDRLRGLGFRVAIDDLGAGQGDSGTFAQLEPEFVKIDLSVIRGVDKDPSKQKMVQALVRLCHNMGKTVIAEGVENAGERDTLVETGCDFLQGYFLGSPAPLQASKSAPPA